MCMQLPTQEQFVKDCWNKYFFTDIPSDQRWEEAHYPLPSCLGGEDTLLLWSADHVVQGLLQSVKHDHKCFNELRNKNDTDLLTAHYPEYLELFQQLKSEFGRRRAAINKVNSTGAFYDPKIQSANGRKTAELRIGIHAPGIASAGGKKGGRKGGKITGAKRYQCLVTGFITNAGCLARYQRARGIDTSLRIQISE